MSDVIDEVSHKAMSLQPGLTLCVCVCVYIYICVCVCVTQSPILPVSADDGHPQGAPIFKT